MKNSKVLIKQAKPLRKVDFLLECKSLENEIDRLIKENQDLKQVLSNILAQSTEVVSVIGK